MDFDPHDTRYLTLRWTRKKQTDEPVMVVEISALGEATSFSPEIFDGSEGTSEQGIGLPQVQVASP